MRLAIRETRWQADPPPCRCELIQSAFETGCCAEFQGEALLDRLAVSVRDPSAASRSLRTETAEAPS